MNDFFFTNFFRTNLCFDTRLCARSFYRRTGGRCCWWAWGWSSLWACSSNCAPYTRPAATRLGNQPGHSPCPDVTAHNNNSNLGRRSSPRSVPRLNGVPPFQISVFVLDAYMNCFLEWNALNRKICSLSDSPIGGFHLRLIPVVYLTIIEGLFGDLAFASANIIICH